jgi:hypothetical protein
MSDMDALAAEISAIFADDEVKERTALVVDYTSVPLLELVEMQSNIKERLLEMGEMLRAESEDGRELHSRYFAIVNAINNKKG